MVCLHAFQAFLYSGKRCIGYDLLISLLNSFLSLMPRSGINKWKKSSEFGILKVQFCHTAILLTECYPLVSYIFFPLGNSCFIMLPRPLFAELGYSRRHIRQTGFFVFFRQKSLHGENICVRLQRRHHPEIWVFDLFIETRSFLRLITLYPIFSRHF